MNRARKILEERHAFFDLNVDASTWEALRPIVAADFPDPALLRRLAYHFDRVRSLRRLAELQGNLAYGSASAFTDSKSTFLQLSGTMYTDCVDLIVDARDIETELSALIEDRNALRQG